MKNTHWDHATRYTYNITSTSCSRSLYSWVFSGLGGSLFLCPSHFLLSTLFSLEMNRYYETVEAGFVIILTSWSVQ